MKHPRARPRLLQGRPHSLRVIQSWVKSKNADVLAPKNPSMSRVQWRLLLLLLLPLLWYPAESQERNVVVLAPPEVNSSQGNTVILPCKVQPVDSEITQVKQIRWERLEPFGNPRTVAEFHWDLGPSIKDPDHVQFIAAGKDLDLLDASLALTKLEPYDDANYTCEVTTFLQGSGRASTWLRVFYAPQVSMSLYDGIGPLGHRETSLSCDARGNPEPRSYEWSTTTGSLPPYAVPQGARLLLQPSGASINTTFICRVSNALGTTQISMRVLLPGPPKTQSLSRSHWPLIVSIVAPVAVVLGVLLYYCRSRKSRLCSIRTEVTTL